MPTGYTVDVQSGKVTEFRDFALQCARAFGALVTMRDGPVDAPIPERFAPSDYHTKAIALAKADLADVGTWTPDRADFEAMRTYEREHQAWERREAEKGQQRARYEAMLAKVNAWTPPTPDHAGLKEFMAKQLSDSIPWDCAESKPPEILRGAIYREKRLAEARRDLDYHIREDAKEQARAAERTEWIRALRASLAI